MSTIRQKAKAAAKPEKKVVKPVLTTALTLRWPELSTPAQAQIEAALRDVLKPLADARLNQSQQEPSGTDADPPPQASTSKVTLDGPVTSIGQEAIAQHVPSGAAPRLASIPVESTDESAAHAKGTPKSRRAKRRAHLRNKLQKLEAQLPPDTHELSLRSGRNVQIPDRLQSGPSLRKNRLDKVKALANRPLISDSLIIGLNAVTTCLEESLEMGRCQLAGVPYPLATAFSSRTAKNDLRLYLPAPDKGSRRDRRALKKLLQKRPSPKKQAGEGQTMQPIPHLPSHLAVARDEHILKHALQDMQDRLKEEAMETGDVRVFLNNIEEISACLELQKPSDGPEMTEGEESSIRTGVSPGSWQIPTYLVDSIMSAPGWKASENQNRECSMLLALLERYDPTWFRIWMQRDAALKSGRMLVELEAPKVQNSNNAKGSVQQAASISSIRLVFVAKADINPVHLVQHLLTSVAANNSLDIARRKMCETSSENGGAAGVAIEPDAIYLVPLSKGAEEKLAALLALRRVSVLAFTSNTSPEFQKLLTLVKVHLPQPLSAEWLIPAINSSSSSQSQQGNLVPAHVKLLHTTAPTDIKALRAEKKRKRQAAQEHSVGQRKAKKPRPDLSDRSTSRSSHAVRKASAAETLIDTQPKLP